MAYVFNGSKTKDTPESFPGVMLKSFIHPDPQFHDGYVSGQDYEAPQVRFSFGLFTIDPHHQWPATRFDIAEVSYCIEGEGLFICDDIEHSFKTGDVIYIPKGEARIIKNTSNKPLKYLCIVDPAWQPEYSTLLD